MDAIWFRLISEKFFTWVASPTIWGKTRVKYDTETSLRPSGEAAPMAILITDGVGKGDLGIVTTFCSHNQVKMEVFEMFATLHQYNPHESSVFMVRQYTNTLFIPKEPPGSSTLMWVIFPGVLLLPSFLWTACVYGSCFHILRPRCSYPMKRGRWVQNIPPFPRGSMEMLQRVTPPLQPHVTINAFTSCPSLPRRRQSDGEKIGL